MYIFIEKRYITINYWATWGKIWIRLEKHALNQLNMKIKC